MRNIIASMISAVFTTAAAWAQAPAPVEIFQREIAITRDAPVATLPIDWRMQKIFIEAETNGQSNTFIFDTGSPTILSRALADSLGLESVGQNVGRDAHGAEVVMDVAVLDTLRLGTIVFSNVPVMIFDFDHLQQGRCFIEGGVIGSEILRGSAWRIDLSNHTLSIAEHRRHFEDSQSFVAAPLYDFGYPHMPIVDYTIGNIEDKALFDTGYAGQLALFQNVADDRSVRREIVRGSIQRGQGRAGESAGGWAPLEPLVRAELENLYLGGTHMPVLSAALRPHAPTLIGAGLLQDYAITLDFPENQFILTPLNTPHPRHPNAEYGIGLLEGRAEVIQLYDRSQAARAGLELGDEVIAINARALTGATASPHCETARWLVEDFQPHQATELTVLRNGEPVQISIPAN